MGAAGKRETKERTGRTRTYAIVRGFREGSQGTELRLHLFGSGWWERERASIDETPAVEVNRFTLEQCLSSRLFWGGEEHCEQHSALLCLHSQPFSSLGQS